MKSTLKSGMNKRGNYVMIMDANIDILRRKIWDAIIPFEEKGMSLCDVSMALGIVQYELVHHSDENPMDKFVRQKV